MPRLTRSATRWLAVALVVGIVSWMFATQTDLSFGNSSSIAEPSSPAVADRNLDGAAERAAGIDPAAREASRESTAANNPRPIAGERPFASPTTPDPAAAGQLARRPVPRSELPQDPGSPERPGSPGLPGGSQGGLADRTGWGGSLGEQLNRDLMPLVDECIELAQERRPALEGMLAVSLVVVPTEDRHHDTHRAMIGHIEPTPRNEIDDPELFECIEQTSFTLEGLDAPSDFMITIPIEPRA